MTWRVWVDDWQMQCCGTEFGVGSTVEWAVRGPDRDWLDTAVGPRLAATVTHAEEHHGGDTPETVAGVVTAIKAVYHRLAPSPDSRMLVPVPDTAVLVPVERADGWEPARDGLTFRGYLADVRES